MKASPRAKGTVLLETMVEKREDPDPYTGETEDHEHCDDEHCDDDHCDDEHCHCGHHHGDHGFVLRPGDKYPS